MREPAHFHADGLSAGQRRTAVATIVALHAALAWGLMQVREVREAVTQSAPLLFDMVTPPAPPTPPAAPVPPPPAPRPPTKLAPPVPLVAAPPSPAPTPFVAPQPEVVEPPAPVVVEAPPAPPTPPPPPRTIPASAVQYLDPPVLEYPRASRRAGEAGRVIVRVYIDEAGVPRQLLISKSSGFARLDDAALAAVRAARFRPYTENGQPTAGWASIPLAFDLEK
ncbi:energy transducer TonB [Piscinibacter sp. XHJ-5]|uniref:energy transducer TonB n=1 Tax=Piscinibacter sp. XHJ-5 TaxID=3037797 RepID=UPI002452F5C8|nr:energy transducer TonB [Piscinibacter sp. XHJ-5]